MKTIAGAMPAYLATLYLGASDRSSIFFIISEALLCNDDHHYFSNFYGIHNERQICE